MEPKKVQYKEQHNTDADGVIDDTQKLISHINAGDRILDVGAGSGHIADLICCQRTECHVELLETDADMNSVLGAKYQRNAGIQVHSPKLDYFLAVKILKKRSIYYDTIVMSAAIHEIFSFTKWKDKFYNREIVSKIVEEAASLLSPGGKLIIRDGVLPENYYAADEFEIYGDKGRGCELADLAVKYAKCMERIGDPLFLPRVVSLDKHAVRCSGSRAALTNLLYTITWGTIPFHRECRKLNSFFSLTDWIKLADTTGKACGLKITYMESYLQDGYVNNLDGYTSFGRRLPDSNCIVVLEKS